MLNKFSHVSLFQFDKFIQVYNIAQSQNFKMKKQAIRTIEYLLADTASNNYNNSAMGPATHQFSKITNANMASTIPHNMNKLLPLSAFKSNKYHKFSFFPEAKQLPTFFQSNLVNDGRVVKELQGYEGVLRGFYYQLLKLGFEIESNPIPVKAYEAEGYSNQNSQHSNIDYSSIIKNALFDGCLFSPLEPYLEEKYNSAAPASGKKFNISQYCRIIIEFMLNLESQVIPNVDLTIAQYPIIDEAFLTVLGVIIEKNYNFFIGKTGIFDNMVGNYGISQQKFHPRSAYHAIKTQQQISQSNGTIVESLLKKITIESLLFKLCELFNITLQVFDNCFSFSESDVFMYIPEENPTNQPPAHVYLAYLSEMAEVESFSESQHSSSLLEDARHSSSIKKKSINSYKEPAKYHHNEGEDYDESDEYEMRRDMENSGSSNPNKVYQSSSRYSNSIKESFRLSAGNLARGRARDIPYKNKKNSNPNINVGDSLSYSQSRQLQNRQNQEQPNIQGQQYRQHELQSYSQVSQQFGYRGENKNSHSKSMSNKSLSLDSLIQTVNLPPDGRDQNTNSKSIKEKNGNDALGQSGSNMGDQSKKGLMPVGRQQRISELDREYEQSSQNNNNTIKGSQDIEATSNNNLNGSNRLRNTVQLKNSAKMHEGYSQNGREQYYGTDNKPISPLKKQQSQESNNLYTAPIIESHSVESISEGGSHSATGEQISVIEYRGRALPINNNSRPRYHNDEHEGENQHQNQVKHNVITNSQQQKAKMYEEIQNIKNKQHSRRQSNQMTGKYYNNSPTCKNEPQCGNGLLNRKLNEKLEAAQSFVSVSSQGTIQNNLSTSEYALGYEGGDQQFGKNVFVKKDHQTMLVDIGGNKQKTGLANNEKEELFYKPSPTANKPFLNTNKTVWSAQQPTNIPAESNPDLEKIGSKDEKGRKNQHQNNLNMFNQLNRYSPGARIKEEEQSSLKITPKNHNIYTSNKIELLERQAKRLDKNGKNAKDDSLGTFYKEFSDTKVMEAMIEPFKSHVKNTRKKFKGIHKKDFKGLL